MALLKDLIVSGATKLIGDAYLNIIKSGTWNGTAINGLYGGLGKDARSLGGTTTPIYIDSNGVAQTCTAYASASVSSASTAAALSAEIANDKLPARLREGSSATNASADTFKTSGFWYSNTAASLPTGVTDANIIGAFHSKTYGHQIAFKYASSEWSGTGYDGKDLWTRSLNAGTWKPWYQILTAGNIPFVYSDDIYYDNNSLKFVNTRATNAWSSQVYSKEGYVDNVAVSWKPCSTSAYVMVGLNSDPTTDANYTSIDYCWYTQNGGGLTIYESGSGISSITGHTTYSANDDLRIEYSNGYVKYYHNGVLCRQVARAISGKLYFDSSFYNGGSIQDVKITPLNNAEFITSTASYSLSNGAWTEAVSLPAFDGTYIIQLTCNDTIASGVFSVRASGDSAKDEISLHVQSSSSSFRIYARTDGTKLKLASTDSSATSRSVTIKIKRII